MIESVSTDRIDPTRWGKQIDTMHVLIPTHGRPDLLQRTLASLAGCELPSGYAGCVVIENGGRHGAEAVCRGAEPSLKVRYLYHDQGNKSATLNRALGEVSGELIVFLDDDVRLSPRVLTAYADAAGRHGPGHWFAGPTGADYEREPPVWLKKSLPASARGWEWKDGEDIEHPNAMGFNWAAFTGDLRRAGGFDPEFGPGSPSGATGQESDMMGRLLSLGVGGRFVPAAFVWHFIPADRCTPEWLIGRAYRIGLQFGLRYRGKGSGVPMLFGYPRWLIRMYLTASGSAQLARFGSREARLTRRVEFQKLRGWMDGTRLSKRPVPARDAPVISGPTCAAGVAESPGVRDGR